MMYFVLALALGSALRLEPQAADVRNDSYVAPDGTRVLRQSLVVAATPAQVWQAFTTTEGVTSWAVPVAQVDFRIGGIWESTYKPDGRIGDPGNIKNRFLSFLPVRMLSFHIVAAPPDFPHKELLSDLQTIVEIEEQSPNQSRVTISMTGYRQGAGYDAIYSFFEQGNAWSLRKLEQRFREGPVKWR